MDRIPGADTLGFGFDITKRYHESSTTQRIFKEGKPDETTMTIGGKTYAVPQNIATETIARTEGTSQVFSTRQQVQDHFSAKAGITGSGFGFKGHVDASYSHISKSDKSYYYALVEASTHAFNLKLKEQRSEWFTGDFADDVKELPTAFNKETEDLFFAFFGTYGTHFVHQVQLGGSLYYYVAVEKSKSSDETTVKVNMDLEYKGVFAKTKAEASSTWQKLGKEWASSRVVRLTTEGGENNLDGLIPGFDDWKGDSFKTWSDSLLAKPGLAGFNLRPISDIVPLAKRRTTENALREYLRGGLVVKADRDFTPQTARRAYTAYPTIEGPGGVVAPPSPMPLPARREEDVCGIQLVLFNADTLDVILNRDYYVTPDSSVNVDKMYASLVADIKKIQARDYYCAFSVFGLSPIFYPPAEVTGWIGNCGASLSAWQKYIGATGSAFGSICYTFAGRKGVRGGATEEFIFDPRRDLRKVNSTSLYFLRGAGVRALAPKS